MKNTVLVFIALIGLYTIARNNVGVLPDQIMWISHPDIFYKVFLPLLMVMGSIASLIYKDKFSFFLLTAAAMTIDAINRLSVGVNHLYGYLEYKDIPPPRPTPGSITGTVFDNLWPSHIMGIIELALIFYAYMYLKNRKVN